MLCVIDGNNALHRMLHIAAYKQITTVNGHMVGAALGFLRSLHKALVDFPQIRSVIVAWDSNNSFRKAIFPSYKQNRKAKTEEERIEHEARHRSFLAQKMLLNPTLKMLGCRVTEIPNLEGDDIIAGIVALGEKTLILSDDVDVCQLISETCIVYRPIAQTLVSTNDIQKLCGVHLPCDIPWSKALQGDKSDGVQGIRGWGEKRTSEFVCNARKISGNGEKLTLETLQALAANEVKTHFATMLADIPTLERNYRLVDLAQSPVHEQLPVLRSVLAEPVQHQEDKVHSIMTQAGMTGPLPRIEGYYGWVAPFRMLR